MKALFDTSVFVSAFLQSHESHNASLRWLAAAKSGAVSLVVAAHTLAEVYSTLTRMPPRYALAPRHAWKLLETDVLPNATLRTLPAAKYRAVLKRLAKDEFKGGIVYDALIVEVARIQKVDLLLTLNLSHFERVWPDSGGRIVSPETSAPPESGAGL